MALTASTTVWEVRTTGSDGNGGGFNAARDPVNGIDRSQQNAPHVTIDGVAITAVVQATTTDLAITGYVPSTADLGNLVNITGGTMTAGVYEITAIPAAGQWRLDRSGGVAAQTGTGAMGGAAASPGFVGGKVADANVVYIKAGTYLITSTSSNISGGRVTAPRGTWIGYQTTRNDYGTRPVLQVSGVNTLVVFSSGSLQGLYANLEIDGASAVATTGFSGGGALWYRCLARNCTAGGFAANSPGRFILCAATGCSAVAAFNLGTGPIHLLYGCVAYLNTILGISGNNCYMIRCLSIGNTGATVDGFSVNVGACISCVAYGNGQDGFNNGAGTAMLCINCIAESNGRSGYRNSTGGVATSGESRLFSSGFGNVAGTTSGAFRIDVGFITQTATAFLNAAGLDFSLNALAGGGALLRQAGIPGPFPLLASTGYLDGGAVQTSGAPGSGGGGGGTVAMVGAGSWVMG